MKSVRNISVFENIPILVRAAMNVPIEKGKVMNDYRLRRAVPTIRFLAEQGAKVVLLSHIGEQGTETLAPVAETLGKLVSGVSFFGETVGERARAAVRDLAPGHILVLENLRRNKGELENDSVFAKELAALGDVFIEDCFDTCHRAHASIVGVPKLLPSYAGFLLEDEIHELSRALTPEKPSFAVIGGMKFSTKEAVLNRLLAIYDHVFVGGALADDFLKALGHEIGKSLVSNTKEETLKELLANPKMVLPVDTLVTPALAVGLPNGQAQPRIATPEQIRLDEIIVDHGPGTSALLSNLTQKAKTVLWNGPLGNYELGFSGATDALARAVAASSAYSIIGGGDTVASIEKLGLLPCFSFVSTGGGAMLDYLAAGSLVGIDALDK